MINFWGVILIENATNAGFCASGKTLCRKGLTGLNQYLAEIKCLAHGHNAKPPVRLKPATPLSRVKQFTTGPPPACPLIFLFGGTRTPWCFHLGVHVHF